MEPQQNFRTFADAARNGELPLDPPELLAALERYARCPRSVPAAIRERWARDLIMCIVHYGEARQRLADGNTAVDLDALAALLRPLLA